MFYYFLRVSVGQTVAQWWKHSQDRRIPGQPTVGDLA